MIEHNNEGRLKEREEKGEKREQKGDGERRGWVGEREGMGGNKETHGEDTVLGQFIFEMYYEKAVRRHIK